MGQQQQGATALHNLCGRQAPHHGWVQEAGPSGDSSRRKAAQRDAGARREAGDEAGQQGQQQQGQDGGEGRLHSEDRHPRGVSSVV